MAKEVETQPDKSGETVSRSDYDALAAKFEELSATVAALQPVADEPADTEPEVNSEEQLSAEKKRVADLYKLAHSAGLDDATASAEKWADQGLTVTQAKAALADRMLAANKLTDDSGEHETDPHEKFRAEFNANRKDLALYGVTDEDAYVRSRCRDEGLEVPAKS